MLVLPKARVVLPVLKSPKSRGQAGSFPGVAVSGSPSRPALLTLGDPLMVSANPKAL